MALYQAKKLRFQMESELFIAKIASKESAKEFRTIFDDIMPCKAMDSNEKT